MVDKGILRSVVAVMVVEVAAQTVLLGGAEAEAEAEEDHKDAAGFAEAGRAWLHVAAVVVEVEEAEEGTARVPSEGCRAQRGQGREAAEEEEQSASVAVTVAVAGEEGEGTLQPKQVEAGTSSQRRWLEAHSQRLLLPVSLPLLQPSPRRQAALCPRARTSSC